VQVAVFLAVRPNLRSPAAYGELQRNVDLSADGRTVRVLIRRLNSSCSRSIAFVVHALRH